MTSNRLLQSAVVSALTLGTLVSSLVNADTALFPVLTSAGPNILTLISVANRPGNPYTHLKYIYRYKNATSASGGNNASGPCQTATHIRATQQGDLVSFDVSGTLGGGNALFGDTGIYGGGFGIGNSAPSRGYLLVTHSDGAGNQVGTELGQGIGGEFVNLDVGAGAAWGGRALNDNHQGGYSFGSGLFSSLPNNDQSFRFFTFFPPSEWTTRFYVTPIGEDMDTAQLTALVGLGSALVFYDRNGISRTFAPIPAPVTCTGMVPLQDLVDSAVWSAVENTGGWSVFGVAPGSTAAVYKLEYTSKPTYGGTVNNGYLLSEYGLP